MAFEYHLQWTWRTHAWRIYPRLEQGAGHPGPPLPAAPLAPLQLGQSPTEGAGAAPVLALPRCRVATAMVAFGWFLPTGAALAALASAGRPGEQGRALSRWGPSSVTHVNRSLHLLCAVRDGAGPAESAATKIKPSQILRTTECLIFNNTHRKRRLVLYCNCAQANENDNKKQQLRMWLNL